MIYGFKLMILNWMPLQVGSFEDLGILDSVIEILPCAAGIITSKTVKSQNLKMLSVSLPRSVRWHTVTWCGAFSCNGG